MGRCRINRIGMKYGKWTIIFGPIRRSDRQCRWMCRCDCGVEKEVREYYLTSGKSTQCRGCAHKGHLAAGRLPKPDSIHATMGVSIELATRIYGAANAAVRRCTNPKDGVYRHYGGRGITVYRPWVENRRLFVEYLFTLSGHDDRSLVLDRINNDGNYEPGNLRFATLSVSHSNIRKKVRHELPG